MDELMFFHWFVFIFVVLFAGFSALSIIGSLIRIAKESKYGWPGLFFWMVMTAATCALLKVL